MSESIQKTISNLVKKENKEAQGKKSTSVKISESTLPIIPITNLTK